VPDYLKDLIESGLDPKTAFKMANGENDTAVVPNMKAV